MKSILLLLLLITPLSSKAQWTATKLIFDIDKACNFDTIMIQSMVTGKSTVQAIEKDQTIDIFDPVDIVLVRVTGPSGMAMAPISPVEKDTISLYITEDSGCNSIQLKSGGNQRLEEFETFKKRDPNEKRNTIFQQIQKNIDAITVQDYLRDYLDGDYANPELSRKILRLFEQNQNNSTSHSFVQSLVANIKLQLNKDPVYFFIPDSSLIHFTSDLPIEYSQRSTPKRLIDFWYTSCGPCLQDHALIKEDIDNNQFPKDVELVGIAIDPSIDSWKSHLEKSHLPWKNFFLDDRSSIIKTKYGIMAYPTYLLLNADGFILNRFHSYRAVLDFMEELENSDKH